MKNIWKLSKKAVPLHCQTKTITIMNTYEKAVQILENAQKEILNKTATLIKENGEVIFIGNTFYSFGYDKKFGIVPTYNMYNCYIRGDKKFLPMYDYDCTLEFGWSDFESVISLCNMIEDYINRKIKKS